MHLDTFEPEEGKRAEYEELFAALGAWGTLRPHPIFQKPKFVVRSPVGVEEQLRMAKVINSTVLPRDLALLWDVTDGIDYRGCPIVFSTKQFIQHRKLMEDLNDCAPFDGLCFIGEIGDGDAFALSRSRVGEWKDDVLIWEHETDRRYPIADSFQEYVAKLLFWINQNME